MAAVLVQIVVAAVLGSLPSAAACAGSPDTHCQCFMGSLCTQSGGSGDLVSCVVVHPGALWKVGGLLYVDCLSTCVRFYQTYLYQGLEGSKRCGLLFAYADKRIHLTHALCGVGKGGSPYLLVNVCKRALPRGNNIACASWIECILCMHRLF